MKRYEQFEQQLLRHGGPESSGPQADYLGREKGGRRFRARWLGMLAALGSLLIVLSWLLPAHWKSLAPSVVEAAGRESSTLLELGMAQVTKEEPGPMALMLAAAQTLGVPAAAKLDAALADLKARKPELVRCGGREVATQ